MTTVYTITERNQISLSSPWLLIIYDWREKIIRKYSADDIKQALPNQYKICFVLVRLLEG